MTALILKPTLTLPLLAEAVEVGADQELSALLVAPHVHRAAADAASFPHTTASTCAEEYLRLDGPAVTACLILDLRMLGIDGLQLQQRLRLDGHEFPIIILTANGSGDDRAQAMLAGAIAFLSKPFDSGVLLATIEAARRRMAAGG